MDFSVDLSMHIVNWWLQHISDFVDTLPRWAKLLIDFAIEAIKKIAKFFLLLDLHEAWEQCSGSLVAFSIVAFYILAYYATALALLALGIGLVIIAALSVIGGYIVEALEELLC